MARKESPILRLFIAMIIGLLIIETAIEFSTGTTLMGGRTGLFIGSPHSNSKTLNTPMKTTGRVTKATDIRDTPAFEARKVGILEVGTTLNIVGKTTVDKEVWYQVQRFGGKIGYVNADTLIVKK